jgi:Tol biopolymer transport system component
MARLVNLVVAILALCLAPLGTMTARAAFPGPNGRIAYATVPAGGARVVKTISRDGTDIRIVANGALHPDWSPDGTKIAFTRVTRGRPCSVQISNPDGSGVRNLTGTRTGCEHNPTFTPDGRRIVFLKGDTLMSMDLQGQARRRIAPRPSGLIDVSDPSVSPDGTTIAFQGVKARSLRALFTIRMDGTQLRRLTSFKLNVGTRVDWAPTGGRLIVTEYKNGGPGNTALVRPDGSGLVILTHYRARVGASGAVFSPDGRSIVFRRADSATGKAAIWRMRRDGSAPTVLRRLPETFCCLDWGTLQGG